MGLEILRGKDGPQFEKPNNEHKGGHFHDEYKRARGGLLHNPNTLFDEGDESRSYVYYQGEVPKEPDQSKDNLRVIGPENPILTGEEDPERNGDEAAEWIRENSKNRDN